MSERRLYVARKITWVTDDERGEKAEGTRIHNFLSNHDSLGVLILNTDFELTVNRVRRLERLLGAVFEERVSVIY